MGEEDNLKEINRKLDAIINILAYQTVKEMTLTQGAPILRRLGLLPTEIATIYDTTPNTVKVRLAEAKKKGKA